MKQLLLLFTLLPTFVMAQSMSDIEMKIMEVVDENHEEAIDFLIENVNMNSGSMNAEGVKALGQRYIDAYSTLGFETEFVDQSEVNRGGHFIARKRDLLVKSYC